MSATILKDANAVISALREYVQAIPDDVAASLPAMPGVDGNWMDDVQAALTRAMNTETNLPGLSDEAIKALAESEECTVVRKGVRWVDNVKLVRAAIAAHDAQRQTNLPEPGELSEDATLQRLHDALYLAQRTAGETQDECIAAARSLLSEYRATLRDAADRAQRGEGEPVTAEQLINSFSNADELRALLASPPADQRPEPGAAQEAFTTPDDDLNALLEATYDMGKGPGNMDTGLYWHECLTKVLERLALPAPGSVPVVQDDAIARLQKYIARRKVARLTDIEHVHTFDGGDEREAVLLLSDIEALIAAPAAQQAPLNGIHEDSTNTSCGVTQWVDGKPSQTTWVSGPKAGTVEELAALGWRPYACPACGEGAMAAPPVERPLHSDDNAVDAFAEAMKAKLAGARAKGRSGWQTCTPEILSRMLREHVEKGDPRDVANFCMFLWALGFPIGAAEKGGA